VIHISLNLLKIKGLHMFRALLAHPQEAPHKRHLVYCVRIMPIGCGTVAVSLQPCHSQQILYARNIPNAVCVAPPEDEQVIFETCTGLWYSINWMKRASRWFHYTDILWCTVSKTLRLTVCCDRRLIHYFPRGVQNKEFYCHVQRPRMPTLFAPSQYTAQSLTLKKTGETDMFLEFRQQA
jgi:hypothetical protein